MTMADHIIRFAPSNAATPTADSCDFNFGGQLFCTFSIAQQFGSLRS